MVWQQRPATSVFRVIQRLSMFLEKSSTENEIYFYIGCGIPQAHRCGDLAAKPNRVTDKKIIKDYLTHVVCILNRRARATFRQNNAKLDFGFFLSFFSNYLDQCPLCSCVLYKGYVLVFIGFMLDAYVKQGRRFRLVRPRRMSGGVYRF